MKKKFTPLIIKLAMAILLAAVNTKAWCMDATNGVTDNKDAPAFSQPWIWIGITVIAMISMLAPSISDKKDFIVVRKKAIVKKP